ncbi:MAG: leucyl aminopeptidase [Candidatus Gracilibacteria bacterium]|nr:leucyl aminopeptidase [Candidatus Gracilibacteria bacterium]
MTIKFSTKADPIKPTVVALFEKDQADKALHGKTLHDFINTSIKHKTFNQEASKVCSTHRVEKTRIQKILLTGFGKEKDWSEKNARDMAAGIIKAAKGMEASDIHIILPHQSLGELQALTEGLILGNYDPALHKTGKDQEKKDKNKIKTITLITNRWGKDHKAMVEKGQHIAMMVNYTRNLVNAPPNMLDIDAFVAEAKSIAKENKYTFTDIDKKKLEKMKMGGILAVNQGSTHPAHMLILEHKGADEDPIVLIGKGIIFDSGGVNLKPSGSMHEMHLDMAGAATVLGIFQLLKKLNIKRHVIGITPVTDNAIDAKSYRPSEVITTYSGKTVEIKNTDAEGRMILCDALHYASTDLKPQYIIDMATLTGACMVALGYRNAGLFGNNEELIKKIEQSAKNTDEPLCHLPITDVDEKAMKGKVADLANLSNTHNYAGSSRAAAFLKNFVNDSKWAHIDLAGPAFTKDPKPYEVSMGSGYGVRLIIDFLENL